MSWPRFVKTARYIGLFGSMGLMVCPLLPVSAIMLSGTMVIFGFSVDRMEAQRRQDEEGEC
jgi:hypothetical protein